MAWGRPLKPPAVSQGAREALESMARSRSLPAGLVRHAEGLDYTTVAERVHVNRQTVVGRSRERFRT